MRPYTPQKVLPALISTLLFLWLWGGITGNIAKLLGTLFDNLPVGAVHAISFLTAFLLPALDLLNEKAEWYDIPITKRIAGVLLDEISPRAHLTMAVLVGSVYGIIKLGLISVPAAIKELVAIRPKSDQ